MQINLIKKRLVNIRHVNMTDHIKREFTINIVLMCQAHTWFNSLQSSNPASVMDRCVTAQLKIILYKLIEKSVTNEIKT